MKKVSKLIGLIICLFLLGCNNEESSPYKETIDTTKSEITIPASKGEIIKHTYYTLSYSEQNEQAEWVYYKLTSNMLIDNQDRTEDFRVDSAVSTGSAELADYKYSGYDRGHLCPAGDMTISYTANSESFYLSNISPQDASFNRGIWQELESTVRNIAKEEKEIYIVTGPVFRNIKGSIGENKVTVPGYFYKIIYAPANAKMIGFVLPNEKCSKEINEYALNVDSIENLTNIDFFPKLLNSIQKKLEGDFDITKWSLIH